MSSNIQDSEGGQTSVWSILPVGPQYNCHEVSVRGHAVLCAGHRWRSGVFPDGKPPRMFQWYIVYYESVKSRQYSALVIDYCGNDENGSVCIGLEARNIHVVTQAKLYTDLSHRHSIQTSTSIKSTADL